MTQSRGAIPPLQLAFAFVAFESSATTNKSLTTIATANVPVVPEVYLLPTRALLPLGPLVLLLLLLQPADLQTNT